MRVYRIEHKKNGLGPYSHRTANYDPHEIGMAHTGVNVEGVREHPGSYYDELTAGENFLDTRVGCSTMELLVDWFDGWLLRLNEADFICCVYEIDKSFVVMGKSGKQLIFDHYRSQRIERIPIDEIISNVLETAT